MIDTKHFHEMIRERNIPIDLVDETIARPDRVENQADGTRHYLKKFESVGSRWLRVIVNCKKQPPTRITAFFDRRLRRQENENKIG